MKKSELLLPVGNYQMCLAAIHNGADAIYVGMPEFNARGRSHDHSWDELKEIIDTCHLYGVHVHLAFNILIFQDELQKAIDVLDKAVALGPDALIIQDLGLVKLVRTRYPELIVHASTQMTITNADAISLLDDLGIQRFVLGRENTLDEIESIKNQTNKELEVFVHGALCVAYSGQCFTSESIGGRSANRGQCAQSCRFDYELFVDGEKKQLLDKKYLVSPKDLCGLNEVEKLQELGIDSFKVEGRLKSQDFVASVARTYRSKIDHLPFDYEESLQQMSVAYSRGFYSGWLNGVAHQELVDGKYKDNRGALLGELTEVKRNKVIVATKKELVNGDGILIVSSDNESLSYGGKINQVQTVAGGQSLQLGPQFSDAKIKKGDKVYLTRRERYLKETKQSYNSRDFQKRIPLTINVKAQQGEKLECFVYDGTYELYFQTENLIELAQTKNNELNAEVLKEKLGGLSHTAYRLESLQFEGNDGLFLNNRDLKDLKQRFVAALNQKRTEVRKIEPHAYELPQTIRKEISTGKSRMNILIRKSEQLETIKNIFSDKENREYLNYIILDYEFGKDYFPSVKELKAQEIPVAIATTRILKPGEYHNFKLISRCAPDAILARNLGAVEYFKDSEMKLLGDFSLNNANAITHEYLMGKGLASVTASYDLNIQQLNELIEHTDPTGLEITFHQYMPEFHMEHCVFAAFMSEGNSFRDCGKPCEKHEVYLKDMYGNRHEIKADQECRNTMFRSTAQSTIKYLRDWQEKGVHLFRFECLHESAEVLEKKLEIYLDFFSGKITVDSAYQILGNSESYGMDLGQVSKTKEYISRKRPL